MKRIDTSKWKEFRVGELFVTEKDGKQVPTGASIPKLELKENGSTPRISVTGINNGILGYFDYVGSNVNNYRVYHNFVSVSFLGTVFYQKGSASLDMKVHCLKPLNVELNEYTGSFLVAAIKASLKNYAYSDQLSSTVLPNVCIKLPASPSNEPDWEYMENYMRKYEQQTNASITALKHLTETHKPKRIDTSKWKEFTLKELGFENFHGKRLTKAERKDGNTPFITAGKENQGIIGTIGNDWPTYNNAITVDMFGNVFYHQGELAGDDNIYFFINDSLNEYVKQFIVVSLQSVIKSSFEYRDQFRQDNADNAKVYLPVTSSGEPDWNLMEQYMRQVELQVKNSIIALTTPTPQVQQNPSNLVNYGTVNIYER